MLCSGDMLDNRYRLTTPIATGGMGEVWRAMEVSLGRVVAVKLLRPELLADPEFDARFQAEARTMAGLTPPARSANLASRRSGAALIVTTSGYGP